ncbi:hypothetical protein NL676_003309 [Syzygium grande]|nr:hypothetical protein NL676_003309 [Syzygium grande]
MELELAQLSGVKNSSLAQPNTAHTLLHFPRQQKPPHFPFSAALHADPKISPDFTISSIPFGGFFPSTHLTGELSPNPFLCDNSAAFDEAGEDRVSQRHHFDHVSNVIHDKKLRRRISNRASARRSRLRKKKQIEELQMQVDQLRGANNKLADKIISLLESNSQILQENGRLKEKVSSLQVIATELLTPFRNAEEVACILKTEALN